VGGPYYAEVGMNTQINYTTTENVTIGSENVTINGSYVIQNIYEMQKVQKSWIYYDFEPSNVEYYYYKDCVFKGM